MLHRWGAKSLSGMHARQRLLVLLLSRSVLQAVQDRDTNIESVANSLTSMPDRAAATQNPMLEQTVFPSQILPRVFKNITLPQVQPSPKYSPPLNPKFNFNTNFNDKSKS